MPRAAEMRVREPDDLAVVILIARGVSVRILVIFAADIMRLLVRVGRELNRPERHGRPGIRVSHPLRADKRVDVSEQATVRLRFELNSERQNCEDKKKLFHLRL